jgi:hypothetical protein
MRFGHARWLPAVALGLALAQDPQAPASQTPGATEPQTTVAPARVGSMAELMSKIIYPTSDAVFYIETRTPKTDAEWDDLQGKTLMLAESANLLMMPGRARDQDRWMADTKLMLDAGTAAFRAAKRHDVAGLVAVNDALYESCVTCHRHYRPNYGRGRGGARE